MRPVSSTIAGWAVLSAVLATTGMAGLPRAQEKQNASGQDSVTGGTPVFTGKKKSSDEDLKAQEEKARQQAAKIRVQSPIVTAPVTVLDSSGEFIYDLDEKDFRILDNGVAQRIQRFEPAVDEPVAAVIVIQTSDSVAPLLEQVKPLGSMFSTLLLGQNGGAAVIFYDDRVRSVQDFSTDSDKLAATLRDLKPQGRQARLNDALDRAVSILARRPQAERRVIIAFGDGFDHGSETQREEVVRKATNAEVAIYGLGFNPMQALLKQKPQGEPMSPLDANVTRPLPPGSVPVPSTSANVYGTPVPVVPIMIATGEIIRSTLASSLLEYYAGYTGGVFHSHWSKNALQEQLSKIASEIQSQYELAYVPDAIGHAGFHRIQVQVNRPGAKVRARAGYFVGEGESGVTPERRP
jgi:VWFA-related protein